MYELEKEYILQDLCNFCLRTAAKSSIFISRPGLSRIPSPVGCELYDLCIVNEKKGYKSLQFHKILRKER